MILPVAISTIIGIANAQTPAPLTPFPVTPSPVTPSPVTPSPLTEELEYTSQQANEQCFVTDTVGGIDPIRSTEAGLFTLDECKDACDLNPDCVAVEWADEGIDQSAAPGHTAECRLAYGCDYTGPWTEPSGGGSVFR